MKYFKFILPILAISLWSCGASSTEEAGEQKHSMDTDSTEVIINSLESGSVNITGSIEGSPIQKIYLYKYGVNPAQTIDSSEIDANGNFSFNLNHQGFNFFGIGFQSNNAALVLLGANDEIMINGSFNNWARDYQVSGTGHSTAIRSYLLMRQNFTDKITVLKSELAAIPKSDKAKQDAINEKGMAIQEEFVAARNAFVKENDDTPALYIVLQDIYDPISDIEQLKAIGKATNKYLPNSMFSEQVNAVLSQAEQQIAYTEQMNSAQGAVGIGKPAPDLNFATPEGKMLSLSSLKGKVILLDFWASWCKPCRMENPNVVKLYNEYKDKGFTVYSVSLDNNKAQWINAIQADGLIWPNHVSDLGGWNSVPAAIYSVNSIPQTYLIDADGTIIAKDLRGQDLANKLKEILG